MMRAIVFLALGLVAGGAATYYALGSARAPVAGGAAAAGDASRTGNAVGRPANGAMDVPATDERLAAYRAAASETDVVLLVAALERAAAEPRSPRTDLAIDASLARLAELDPARAVGVASALALDERVVARAFQSWGRSDFDAALRALAAIETPRLRHAVAVRLLELEGDGAEVERVAAGLPASDRVPLSVEWLARRAEHAPESAFERVLAIDDFEIQARSSLRVAAAWARRNPSLALDRASELPPHLQRAFRSAVSEEWARVDPPGMLTYIAETPGFTDFGSAVQWLPAADPVRALEVARRLSRERGSTLMTIAREVLVERSPDVALAEAQAMAPGRDRDQLMRQLSLVYGKGDPQAALEWLRSNSIVSPEMELAALRATVAADPLRLPELLRRLPAGADVDMLLRSIEFGPGASPEQSAVLANQLLAWDDPRAIRAVASVLFSWSSQEPGKAMDWMIANSAKLPAGLIDEMAQQAARRDPREAIALVERVPPALRDRWIAQVMPPYLRSDPLAALDWLTRYRGQPVYESTLRTIAAQGADRAPRALAQLVTQASPELQRDAARSVALAFADRAEALRWVQTLSDARARQIAQEALGSAPPR